MNRVQAILTLDMDKIPSNFQEILKVEQEVVANWKAEGILEHLFLRQERNGAILIFKGLDEEQVKEKILKIASRFMDVSHLENLSEIDKRIKATVIWGIKESIFKIKNIEGISFRNHIFEEDFSFEDKKASAILKHENKEENFDILFDSLEDYIFVCAFEKQ